MKDWKESLDELLPGQIKWDEPLKKHVAYRIGGPADALVSVYNRDELRTLIQFAQKHALATRFWGPAPTSS